MIAALVLGGAGAAFARGSAESKTIVFIPKSTSATFYLFLVKGAQDKAKELGYKIDYLGPATEADVAAQVDFVRSIVKKHPAGILLAALDSKALIAPVEEAMKAGVPVAMVDSGIDSDAPVASVITDQVKGGLMAGEAMAKLLGEKGLVADHGIQAGSVSAGRSKGFQDAIAKYKGMKALPTMWTDADTTKSMNISTDELTGHPDLKGIFNACAASAGDAQAVKSRGLARQGEDRRLRPEPRDPPAVRGRHHPGHHLPGPLPDGLPGRGGHRCVQEGQADRGQERASCAGPDHRGELQVRRGAEAAPDP